jgi:hypothetical protein
LPAKIRCLSTVTSIPALDIPSILRRAGAWFLQSGIQEPHGGVARYYRIDLGRNNRISTEITGYAASALSFLYRRSGDPLYLNAALSAARFLVHNAWDVREEIFPFEWPPTAEPQENRAFFFDCGVITRGLLNVWRITGQREFLDAAVRCGHAMALRFDHDGQFAPILQLPGCHALPYGNSWSNNPGCYQLKSALGWFELWEATGDTSFQTLYETALDRALANEPAFLPGTAERPRVMDRLHAYSYFLEALLPVSHRPECAAALRDGIRKVSHYLRAIAPEFARSDVYAQLLRVRLFADQLGAVPLDEGEAREEAEAIPAFQFAADDLRLLGGFCFGRRGSTLAPYANPVSTAFCLQALALWQARHNGELRETWRDLI